jgi:hypothetical protein
MWRSSAVLAKEVINFHYFSISKTFFVENRPFVRADRYVPMHQIKLGLRHQDLEGIYLPSFRFSWKLKKLCQVDLLVFESWQTAEDVMVLPCDFTAVCHDSKTKKFLYNFQENLNEGK